MNHIAIDLGGSQSQVCVRKANGEIVRERKVSTKNLAKAFSDQKPCRVILEACAESHKIAEQLLEQGHDVRVVAATLAPTLGVGQRGIKTDQRDARVLSEVSTRVDLPSIHIRKSAARRLKTNLGMRDGLIEARTQLINTVRGWARGELLKIPSGATGTFPRRVRVAGNKMAEKAPLPSYVERQLLAIESLTEQIVAADKELKEFAQEDATSKLLQTIPGVGFLSALHFVWAVDDISRFPNAHSLESYLGITPGENSSSKRKRRTGITKAGPAAMRRVLTQACWVILKRRPNDPLARWGDQVSQRRGAPIAVVGMMRKLAGIMYAMWRDNTCYDAKKVSSLFDERGRRRPHTYQRR